MKTFTSIIEKCPDAGLYVGYIPGFPGAHSQGKTIDELNKNLAEVVQMLLKDGESELHSGRDNSPILLRQSPKDIDIPLE